MNDLDRLVRHLVETLQARSPDSVCRPMAIDDLRRTVLPYRMHRNALGLVSAEDYETLLLRLAAEEGDYVRTFPPEAAERFRAEVASVNPDLGLLDELAEATVAIWEGSLPRIMALEDEALPFLFLPEAPSELPLAYEPEEKPGAAGAPEPDAAAGSWAPRPPAAPPPGAAPANPPPSSPKGEPASVERVPAARSRCLFCGAPLPAGKTVIFCPFCGQQLATTRCPTCDTQLEPGWRHCITCGHPMGPHRADS